ncbi:MarR family transcriptional regulator [Pseudomonas aeruginosa]|uniref:MarR family transcriptional regulator n=1 Tax=Pseudomonas aeruginosa TaxID=287 RepID=UPI000D3358EE|nr:MarR family transcriptional regulator [Pseudomonas aeruginosa]PTZ30060.1 MarR family transcriptional regulator [Pseudomonas aeruginosa]
MTKTKKKSEWAKLPLRWIHKGGLQTFTDMKLKKTRVPEGQEWTEALLHDREARNTCIAALRLYLVLCCRADYKSGEAAVTYPELMKLAQMSRPIVARSITRLVTAGLIRKKEQTRKEGSVIIIERWNDDYAWGKIPKLKLYDGNEAGQMLLLAQFNFSKSSFHAIKVYMALMAFRDRSAEGIAVVSYDKIAQVTGIARCYVAEAINRLYAMDLISYRPGHFNSGSTDDRTNHYLVKGLSARWRSPSQVEWSAPESSLNGVVSENGK